jgi:hypothetical protein
VHLAEVRVAARDAPVDPRLAKLGQAHVQIGRPRTRRVVDVDGRFAGADADATERDPDVAVGAKHALGRGQLGQRLQTLHRVDDRLQCPLAVRACRSIAFAAVTVVHLASLSFAGITRIRFKGSRLPSAAPLSLRIERSAQLPQL